MLNNTTSTTATGTTTTGITTGDGISLHAESTGHGTPLLFLHEFAGDHRSWEPQIRYFSARYRCVTYAARGYPPSGVPADPAAYSQERAVADAVAVLDGLGIAAAHVVGLSMGGFAALHLTLRHPDRVLSTVAAGTGYGAAPERQAAFRAECEAIAAAFENEGSEQVARWYAVGPARATARRRTGRPRSGPSPRPSRPRSRPRARPGWRSGTRSARPGCSSRTRTRVAGPSSRRRWPSTRRWAPR